MKTALNGIAALSLCAFLLAGGAWAEGESAPAPTAEPGPQPFPGIIVNPAQAYGASGAATAELPGFRPQARADQLSAAPS